MCEYKKVIDVNCLETCSDFFEFHHDFADFLLVFQEQLTFLYKRRRTNKKNDENSENPDIYSQKEDLSNNEQSDAEGNEYSSSSEPIINMEIRQHSQPLNSVDRTQDSLEVASEAEIESESSVNSPQHSSDAEKSSDHLSPLSSDDLIAPNIEIKSNSSASSSNTPMEEEHTIISFFNVSGKIESFGTSIFMTMKGQVD